MRAGAAVSLRFDEILMKFFLSGRECDAEHRISLLPNSSVKCKGFPVQLELGVEDLCPSTGFTAFTDLFQLHASVNVPRLKERPQNALAVSAFERPPDLWSAIRGDVMVFHPDRVPCTRPSPAELPKANSGNAIGR